MIRCQISSLVWSLDYATDFKTYEELYDAFKKQMQYFIDIKIKGSNVIEKI